VDAGSVRDFYNDLAATFDLIYADWQESVERQAQALDQLLRQALGPGPLRVLDCACGIGTQTLGLVNRGHRMVACDISVKAVLRAAQLAVSHGLGGGFLVADMRHLPFSAARFDAVICADNSLPHLLDTDSLDAACTSMAAVTRPEGVVIVSVRDYDQLRAVRPRSMPPSFTKTAGGRAITFQLWHWHPDGERYDLELFQLIGDDQEWNVRRRVTTYWALSRADLEQALVRAGWAGLGWYEPEETGFFQPLIMATRPST
jgi:SAM-dependent methyltransferase